MQVYKNFKFVIYSGDKFFFFQTFCDIYMIQSKKDVTRKRLESNIRTHQHLYKTNSQCTDGSSNNSTL